MQDNSPLISVIFCVYNAESTLEDSLDSLLKQTYTNFEIIALNDGSTDQSESILNAYSKKDPRIKVLHQDNCGLTISLNRAIKKAQGKYLARQDADDISLPTRLEKQVAFLENNPDHFLIGSHFLDLDASNDSLKEPSFLHFPYSDTNVRLTLPMSNCFCHSSVLFRNDYTLVQSFYDESFTYAQDYEFWIRIAKHYKLANLKDSLVYRRVHPDAISTKKQKAQRYHAVRAKLRSFHLKPKPLPFLKTLCKDLAVISLPERLLSFLRST
ncbi:Uncharacterized glycosyltransferase HI_1578 [Chlamydiales bacterium SCGC AG-110-M15]|nr:Uncharacterized glycosyltransferase HI_1578 [Chlamydiales bacterium SCGC AG-110-M15]